MTTPASPALGLALALQTGKGVAVTAASDFNKIRMIQVNAGAQQSLGQFAQEVGGGYHGGARFKQYVAGAGSGRMYLRLQEDFGVMLHSLFGPPESDGSSHADGWFLTTFKPVNDVCNHPWLTVRKFIPNCTAADAHGEELTDAKLQGMNISLGAAAPAMVDIGLLSIGSSFVAAATASTWDSAMDAYEDNASAVIANVSGNGLTFGDLTGIDLGAGAATAFAMPTVGLQLSIANAYSDGGINNELIIGQLGMDDLVLVNQSIRFQATYKWKDPDLFKAAYAKYGNTVAAQPTSEVLTDDVEIVMRSPRVFTSTPEQVKFILNQCSIEVGSPQLQGGGVVMVPVTGSVDIQSTPAGYATVEWTHGSAYTGVTYA